MSFGAAGVRNPPLQGTHCAPGSKLAGRPSFGGCTCSSEVPQPDGAWKGEVSLSLEPPVAVHEMATIETARPAARLCTSRFLRDQTVNVSDGEARGASLMGEAAESEAGNKSRGKRRLSHTGNRKPSACSPPAACILLCTNSWESA